MTTKSIPCFKCEKPLRNTGPAHTANQPLDGIEFFTYGHYGSTVFDPMDGSILALNICDECVKLGSTKGHVLKSNAAPVLKRQVVRYEKVNLAGE